MLSIKHSNLVKFPIFSHKFDIVSTLSRISFFLIYFFIQNHISQFLQQSSSLKSHLNLRYPYFKIRQFRIHIIFHFFHKFVQYPILLFQIYQFHISFFLNFRATFQALPITITNPLNKISFKSTLYFVLIFVIRYDFVNFNIFL